MKPTVQWLRKSVQLLVLAFVLAVPFLMQYRVFLETNQIETIRTREKKSVADRIVILLDERFRGSTAADLASATENRIATLDKLRRIRGNHWSVQLFGVSLIDPLAVLESFYASGTLTKTLIIGLLIPVIATLLLGRFFCSWICPAGLLFEITDKIRTILNHRHAVHGLTFWRGNKYVLLVVGLAMSAIIGLPLLGYIYPPALVGRESHRMIDFLFASSVSGIAITGATVVLVGIVLFEVFVSRRAWCRYFCPGGALYSALGLRRVVRLQNQTDICTQCTDCIPACPMGLNPMKNNFGPECDLCLECSSVCQSRSLSLKLALTDHTVGTKQSTQS